MTVNDPWAFQADSKPEPARAVSPFDPWAPSAAIAAPVEPVVPAPEPVAPGFEQLTPVFQPMTPAIDPIAPPAVPAPEAPMPAPPAPGFDMPLPSYGETDSTVAVVSPFQSSLPNYGAEAAVASFTAGDAPAATPDLLAPDLAALAAELAGGTDAPVASVPPGPAAVPAEPFERAAIPMPDLEPPEQTASEPTIVVGRYGPYDFLLRLGDGQGIPVDRPLLLGRRPSPEQVAVEARLVFVDDPQRTVSRSHLLVEPVETGILLRNLSAVNSLVLVGPDGSEAEVEPGGAITVTGECRVILGAYPIAIERS